jgi:O-antigen/teichoic acid export membrane protein
MDQFRQITRKALNFVFLAAVPMMIYFMVFARQGIFLLSCENYAGAVRPMQWIMPTLLFIGLSNVLGIQILVPLNREKVVLWSIIAGAAVDVVLNVALIPRYGASGAAAATSVAELVVLAVQFFVLGKEATGAFAAVSFGKLLPALVVGIAAASWVLLMQWGSFVTLLLSGILFFGSYLAMLLVLKEEMIKQLLMQLLKRK